MLRSEVAGSYGSSIFSFVYFIPDAIVGPGHRVEKAIRSSPLSSWRSVEKPSVNRSPQGDTEWQRAESYKDKQEAHSGLGKVR